MKEALRLVVSLLVFVFCLLIAACAPSAAPTQVVEKVVTVPPQVVKETVIVAGTPQVVERVVTATPAPATPTQVKPTSTPAPQKEKVLTIAVAGAPDTIDPHLRSGDPTNFNITNQLVGLPLEQKVVEKNGLKIGEAGSLVPMLAESYTLSPDGKKLTFKLRAGLKFSNGDPMDAESWRWNYERIFATNGVCATFLKQSYVPDIGHVRVVDSTTLEINADQPSDLLLTYFGATCHGMVNPKIVKEHATTADPWAKDWLRRNDAGSGPFRLVSWTTDQIVLEKNPNWYEYPNYPKADKLVYKVVPDPSTRLFLLGSGAVDAADNLPRVALADLKKSPVVRVLNFPSTTVVYGIMNHKMAPFDNPTLRQAISYAVPYDTIVDNVLQGYGQRLRGYVPNGMPTYDASLMKYDTNLDKAKALLAEAGYAKGLDLELTIDAGVPEYEGAAVWMKDNFAKIGVNLNITKVPKGTYNDMVRKRGYAFSLNLWHTTINDPLNHLNWNLVADCCNYSNFGIEEAQTLITKNFTSADKKLRDDSSRRAQQLAMEDANWLLLFQPDVIIATGADVKDVVFYPEDEFWRYRFWYKAGW